MDIAKKFIKRPSSLHNTHFTRILNFKDAKFESSFLDNEESQRKENKLSQADIRVNDSIASIRMNGRTSTISVGTEKGKLREIEFDRTL